MKQAKRLLILPILLIMAGCGTTSILPPVQPGNDAVLVNAQRTATTAHEAFDFLFQVERENEAYVLQYAPSIHTGVNAIRRQAKKAEDNAWDAIETYRTNRTAANKADLNTYIATLQKLLDEARDYTQQIQSKTKR